MKLSARESYNDVIERLLEDLEELDEKTVKEIQKAEKDIKAGKFKTHEQVKRELGFD
jgi:predicted transcriptional regulator